MSKTVKNITRVRAIPGSKKVVVTSTDGILSVVDTENLSVTFMDKTTHDGRDITCVYTNKDYIVTGDNQGNVNLFSTSTLERHSHINGSKKRKENGSISCLFLSSDFVFVCKEDCSITAWNINELRKSRVMYVEEEGYVTHMETAAGFVIMSCKSNKSLCLLNTRDWSIIRDSTEYAAPIISFSVKKDHIAVMIETGVVILSHILRNKTLAVTECPPFSRFTTFDVDPQRNLALVDFASDAIVMIDIKNGKVIKKLSGFTPFKSGACFVGNSIVAFDYSGTMYKHSIQ